MSLLFDGLRGTRLEDEGATVICDPYPDQFSSNAGTTLADCLDGLVMGLGALQSAGDSAFNRLHLGRQACASFPCTSTELNRVTVTGWSNGLSSSVVLDFDALRATGPSPDPLAEWPLPTSTEGPPVARPVVSGAPKAVREREALPFCGNVDTQAEAMLCFRDAVLDGRPAEVLDPFEGIEGSRGVQVFRYMGHGLISRYAPHGTEWQADVGGLILGATPSWWYEEMFAGPPLR